MIISFSIFLARFYEFHHFIIYWCLYMPVLYTCKTVDHGFMVYSYTSFGEPWPTEVMDCLLWHFLWQKGSNYVLNALSCWSKLVRVWSKPISWPGILDSKCQCKKLLVTRKKNCQEKQAVIWGCTMNLPHPYLHTCSQQSKLRTLPRRLILTLLVGWLNNLLHWNSWWTSK